MSTPRGELEAARAIDGTGPWIVARFGSGPASAYAHAAVKVCPYCAEELADDIVECTQCGRDTTVEPGGRQGPGPGASLPAGARSGGLRRRPGDRGQGDPGDPVGVGRGRVRLRRRGGRALADRAPGLRAAAGQVGRAKARSATGGAPGQRGLVEPPDRDAAVSRLVK